MPEPEPEPEGEAAPSATRGDAELLRAVRELRAREADASRDGAPDSGTV